MDWVRLALVNLYKASPKQSRVHSLSRLFSLKPWKLRHPWRQSGIPGSLLLRIWSLQSTAHLKLFLRNFFVYEKHVRYTPGWSNSRFQDLVMDFQRLFYTNHEFENRTFGWVNLVPRVLSYPLCGASLRLSRSVGRVGENPGNEVAVGFDWFFLLSVSSISFDCRTQSNLMHELISIEFDWNLVRFTMPGYQDCPFSAVFLTIKTLSQNVSITLLHISLKPHEHRGGCWRKKLPWTSLEEKFPVPSNTAASIIGYSVISLLWQLPCYCNPDHNKFSSLSNTTVVAVFAQTWEILILKNCNEPP